MFMINKQPVYIFSPKSFALSRFIFTFATDSRGQNLAGHCGSVCICSQQQKVHGYSRRVAAHSCQGKVGREGHYIGKAFTSALFLTA